MSKEVLGQKSTNQMDWVVSLAQIEPTINQRIRFFCFINWIETVCWVLLCLLTNNGRTYKWHARLREIVLFINWSYCCLMLLFAFHSNEYMYKCVCVYLWYYFMIILHKWKLFIIMCNKTTIEALFFTSTCQNRLFEKHYSEYFT